MQQTNLTPQQQANDATSEEVSEYIWEESQGDGGKVQGPYQKEERWLIIEKVADQLEQNRGERLKYAKKTFTLTCWWIMLVLVIVTASGLEINGEKILDLSERIIIVLITTTTVNVFGFFLLVMQFLFNKREMSTIEFLFSSKQAAPHGTAKIHKKKGANSVPLTESAKSHSEG